IKDIATFRRGSFPQPYTEPKWYGGDNSMPFIQVIDFANTMQLNEKSKQSISKLAQPKSVFVPKGTIIVTLQGTIGKVAITQYDAYVDRTIAIFTNYLVNINKKFFAYALHQKFEIEKEYARGSTLKTITKEEFSDFLIPIPPLEIQQEIVKILDAFTELNTELNTELKARKKQYEYYQNMLLDFDDINQNHKDAKEKLAQKTYPKRLKTLLQTLAPKGVEFRKLGEVCDFQKGKSITKKAVTFGKVPVISGGRQPAYYHNEANRSGETIAISSSGVYAGYVSYWDIPVFLADSFSVSPKQKTLMPKYLFHYLTTQQDAIHATKSTGGIPHVYSKDLQNFLIPIPPLEIQQEIVKILDQFSLLTTDLLAGIPAEIEARKKQYEYYREKLLTFKPLTPNKEVKKC
ncbi:restriction endonuclease subunit S, partial [Helicobacter pylori]